jgi:hypothetical protein
LNYFFKGILTHSKMSDDRAQQQRWRFRVPFLFGDEKSGGKKMIARP